MKRSPVLLALAAGAFLHAARADDAKHVDHVTDAAKAAFEKMSRTACNPFRQGMKSASGTITTTVEGAAMAMKFTLAAPSQIHVEADPQWKGVATAGGRTRSWTEGMLRVGCGLFEPSADVEFDADVVPAGGHDVLQITHFQNNAETSREQITLDANGLMTSATSHRPLQDGAQKRDVKTDTSFAWTKVGDAWRLDRIASVSELDRSTVTITYADEAGRLLPVTWRSESSAGASEFRMSELTLDGAKIDLSKPAAAKPAHAHPLGDLSAYATIAKDALKMAESGDLKGAKARMKDIETAWDADEEKMKPSSPGDWETVDKAIDKALSNVRSKTPEKTGCVSALNALIAAIDRVQ